MKKHFTLIELLVVIAIIAILAAILLPALQSARARGRTTDCINTMRQLNMIASQYAEVYSAYPIGLEANETAEPKRSWNIRLISFAVNRTVDFSSYDAKFLHCPEDHDIAGPKTSYGINGRIAGLAPQRFKQTHTIIFFDYDHAVDGNNSDYYPAGDKYRWHYRHQNKSINLAFFDGSVENWREKCYLDAAVTWMKDVPYPGTLWFPNILQNQKTKVKDV